MGFFDDLLNRFSDYLLERGRQLSLFISIMFPSDNF
jgi:hypothetical protein